MDLWKKVGSFVKSSRRSSTEVEEFRVGEEDEVAAPKPRSRVGCALSMPLQDWTVSDVGEWLTQVGHADKVEIFRSECVDGDALVILAESPQKDQLEWLKVFGFTAKGHMMKFLRALKEAEAVLAMNEAPTPSPPPTPSAASSPTPDSALSGWSVVIDSSQVEQPLVEPNRRGQSSRVELSPVEPNQAQAHSPLFCQLVVLPPVEPNHVRVHISPGKYRDVPTNPEDTMEAVYKAVHADYPGAVLAELPSKSRAVLRADTLVTEVQLFPCAAIPLALPAELCLTFGDEGNRDLGLVQLREILKEEYRCWQSDGRYVFKHMTHGGKGSDLVVLPKVLRRLDTFIRGRKVGFLSAVGKPREGKSTLLTLIGRHFMDVEGMPDVEIFRASDSVRAACTWGLWVSTQELTQCRSEAGGPDPDSTVMLLDAEGLFADEEGKGSDYFVQIFTIVGLLSSCMILNVKIDNTVDERFKGFPGQLAATFKGFYDNNPWFREHAPSVVYLARDWRMPQDLDADWRDWEEAKFRGTAPNSDSAIAMTFIRDAFSSMRFCTLGSPVEAEDKRDVLNKQRAPGFTAKLKDILERVIQPTLRPKRFTDPKTGTTHAITGVGPLEQLLTSLLQHSQQRNLDWPSALRSFSEQAAMQAVDETVRVIGKELEEQFAAVIVERAGGVAAKVDDTTLRRLAGQVGVELWLSSGDATGSELRAKGSVAQVRKFVGSLDTRRFVIQPPCPRRMLDHLRQKWRANFSGVCEPLRSFGFTSETAATLMETKVAEILSPLVDLVRLVLMVAAEQAVQAWEERAPTCSDERHIQEEEIKAVERLGALVVGFAAISQASPAEVSSEPESGGEIPARLIARFASQLAVDVEQIKASIHEKTLSIVQAKEDAVRIEVERAYVQKLGRPLDGELAELVKEVSGTDLFRAQVSAIGDDHSGTALSLRERDALSVAIRLKMLQSHQPAMLQSLANRPDVLYDLVQEHCSAAEKLLQMEQTARLQEHINLALQPLGFFAERTSERMVRQLLFGWVCAATGSQTIMKELFADDALDTTDITFLDSLNIMEREIEALGCATRLGEVWAGRLRDVMTKLCADLRGRAQCDYQLALYGKTEEDLIYLLKNSLGIERITLDHWTNEGSSNRFVARFESQADREKVMTEGSHIQDFSNIGFRPAPECWASLFDETVLTDEAWSSCITRKRTDDGRILYNADLETRVLNKFTSNICIVGGKRVTVFRRFPMLVSLTCTGQVVDQDDLRQRLRSAVGDTVECSAPILLGRPSRIMCVTVEAPPQVREKLRGPKTLDAPVGQSGKPPVVVGSVEREWVWSRELPASIAQEVARWHHHQLQWIKATLAEEMTAKGMSDCRGRVMELAAQAFLEVDDDCLASIVRALEADQIEKRQTALGSELLLVAREICASISVEFDSTRHTVLCVVEQDLALTQEELAQKCLAPLARGLAEEVRNHAADEQWLRAAVSKDATPGGLAADIKRQLRQLAEQLLVALAQRRRLEIVGYVMAVNRLDHFVEGASKIFEKAQRHNVDELVSLVYRLQGRRHVPESLVWQLAESSHRGASSPIRASDNDHAVSPFAHGAASFGATAPTQASMPMNREDVDWAVEWVRRLCERFAGAQECRVLATLADNLGIGASDVLAYYQNGDNISFLLRDADAAFPKLLEHALLNCDLTRQVPCQLRCDVSALSVDVAFANLDKLRALGAFVTKSDLQGVQYWATLSVWQKHVERLPLRDFECWPMHIVKDAKSLSNAGAFPVDGMQSVFFGPSFAQEPRLPVGLRGVPLMPKDTKPPPAVPEAGMDLEVLQAFFSNLDGVKSEYGQGRVWDADAAQQLLKRCNDDGAPREEIWAREASVRVMVMAHTRGAIEAASYMPVGDDAAPVALKRPEEASSCASGSRNSPVRFPETTVMVTRSDTLGAAREAVRGAAGRVLVLNMANRDHPGGGYKKGSRAQEEDLFRRTTLSQSLGPRAYPLREFEPSISRNVTAFRGAESEGWPLLRCTFTFDVISVSAYNGNVGKGGQEERFRVTEKRGQEFRFTEEGFRRTVLNISRLLEAAALSGYDHVILGALGCGAFANNPREVAGIFKHLLPMFGGCFRIVEFAVFNMPGQPSDNFQVFQQSLQPAPDAPAVLQRVTDWGHHPGSSDICPRLGLCEQWNLKGHSESWHPPECAEGDGCLDQSSEHRKLRRHKVPCPDRCCKKMFGPEAPEHSASFAHPEICKDDRCRDPRHLHPPPCPRGLWCRFVGKVHPDDHFYAHKHAACRYGTRCYNWKCHDHMASFSHPSTNLCPDAAWCQNTTQDKAKCGLAHVCPWGSGCKDLQDENHTRFFIHPAQDVCAAAVRCNAHEKFHFEDHLDIFHHHGVKFLRPLCKYGAQCRQRRPENVTHAKQYAHPMPEWTLPVCAVYGHNTVRNLMEENPTCVEVSFEDNAKNMIDRVLNFPPFKGTAPKTDVLQNVVALLRRSRPVHRLSVTSFAQVAQSGFLASHHFLTTSSMDVRFAVQLPFVVRPLRDYPEDAQQILAFVDTLVKSFAQDVAFKGRPETKDTNGKPAFSGSDANMIKADLEIKKANLHHLPAKMIRKLEADVDNFLSGMNALRDAVAKGEVPQFGIGYDVDKYLETNKMNFAVLGPHTLRKYSEDKDDQACHGVHLLFNNAILYHPDVFCTPMAATFYHSGGGDGHRPWSCQGKGNDRDLSFSLMLKEKLHPSAPQCFEALAVDFIARAAKRVEHPGDYKNPIPEKCDMKALYRPLSDVTYEQCLMYMKNCNAHYLVETHLPYLTSLALVETVVVAQRSFEKLSDRDQGRAKEVFGGKLLKTPDDNSSKKQWELASSDLPWPELPHAFQWSQAAVASAEVVLPQTLPPQKPWHLFFRTSAPNFTIKFAKSRKGNTLDRPFTISMKGDRCSARGVAGKEEFVMRFNENLRPNERSVMYCVEVVPGSMTVKHVGASQIFNSQKLKLGPSLVPKELKFVSFSAEGFIQFTDVRVLVDDGARYEHERESEPANVAQREALKVDVGEDANSGGTASGGWTAGVRYIWSYLTSHGGSSVKPVCDMGLHCEVAYRTERGNLSEEQQRHLKDWRHVCLYGKSCNQRGSPEHQENTMHLDKPDCPDGDRCKKLGHAHHRAEFHHLGKWDFLLPCRDGKRCVADPPSHRERYHHDSVKYEVTSKEVRLLPMDGADGYAEAPASRGAASSAGLQRPPSQHTQQEIRFVDVAGSVQEDMDDLGDFYNQAAVNGLYGTAKLDQYGSPIGDFELAKDGALTGYTVLVGAFYRGEGLPEDLDTLAIPQLKKKGFEVVVCNCMGTFTDALKTKKVHVAWIISSNALGPGSVKEFVAEVRRFHEAGRGIMFWGDNNPFYVHANAALKDLFDFELTGCTPGGKELVPGDAGRSGCFDRSFLVCAGLERIHEGVTLCYPTKIQPGWKVFGTSSNDKVVLLAKEASSQERGGPGTGRVIVDNGFTKIMRRQWDSAGTPRYVINCTVWLVLRERFRFPGWEWENRGP